VIRPGARERAILLQGQRPGTVVGSALRLFTQFKAFPTAVITKAWGRELYGGQGGAGATAGIVHMMVAATALGYLAMSAKDLVKGRNPRDPTDPKTWAAAFLQGGGAGIYGDFLVGEFSRFGRSFWETALGPTAGTVGDVVGLWNQAKQGQDPSAEAFQAALSHTPFLNLFYVKPALDYLVLYQVQEALNPGFLRRFERRIEQQNRQTFWLRPTEAVR